MKADVWRRCRIARGLSEEGSAVPTASVVSGLKERRRDELGRVGDRREGRCLALTPRGKIGGARRTGHGSKDERGLDPR